MIDWSPIDRHDRVAVSFSGGKDSTVVVWALRQAGLLDRVTVYHLDTGDLFPDMADHVREVSGWCPHWVTVRTNPREWAALNGEPSDLVPYSAHRIGQMRADGALISHRFDCCAVNLMLPLHQRIMADAPTLIVRGTRRDDQPRLPVASGQVTEGVEHFYPLQEWTEDQVFAFAAEKGVPLPRLYEHFRQGPECATCPAWWGVDNGPYLKARYPELFSVYRERLATVVQEITPSMTALNGMLASFTETVE